MLAHQTLSDLAASTPNGFHDAELMTLAVDYQRRELKLELQVWIGDLDCAEESVREAYRHAEICLSGLLFFICQPPDPSYPYDQLGTVRIDMGEFASLTDPPAALLPPVTPPAFLNWIFVTEWNAFIYVAAHNAELRWLA